MKSVVAQEVSRKSGFAPVDVARSAKATALGENTGPAFRVSRPILFLRCSLTSTLIIRKRCLSSRNRVVREKDSEARIKKVGGRGEKGVSGDLEVEDA